MLVGNSELYVVNQSVRVDGNGCGPAADAIEARDSLIRIVGQHEGESVLLANLADHHAILAAVQGTIEGA
jgi:hypothetical protein